MGSLLVYAIYASKEDYKNYKSEVFAGVDGDYTKRILLQDGNIFEPQTGVIRITRSEIQWE